MPDKDGWHDKPFAGPDGRMAVWHYCEGHEHDTLVPDTVIERRQHLRACRGAMLKERAKQERARRRENTLRLRVMNRQRAEARAAG